MMNTATEILKEETDIIYLNVSSPYKIKGKKKRA